MTAPDTKAIRAMAKMWHLPAGIADAITAQAEENRRLREALALLTVRAGSLVFAHHHGNGLEGWHKVIEGVDCALTQARSALSSTGEKV